MLVVSRKPNQSILVDGPCRITVLRSACKLGIDGQAAVVREELATRRAESEVNNRTVYLVDDDADLLRANQRYLGYLGYHVVPFDHGGQFLQYARDNPCASAAILDLRLAEEDIDGLAILTQLRRWRHDYPVIMLTGYGDVARCRSAFQAGCYTFLQKPLGPEDLAATLEEAVTRYERGEIGVRHFLQSLPPSRGA